MLEQVGLVIVRLNQGLIAVGGPSPRQHVQEAKCTLCVLVDEMRYDILVLLCTLYRKEQFLQAAWLLFEFLPSLFRRKLTINTHQSSHSAHLRIVRAITVVKPADQVGHTVLVGLGTDIEEYDEGGVEEAAKSLEKPQMRGQFGAVEMFKAGHDLEIPGVRNSRKFSFKLFALVCHTGVPQILIEKRDVLLDGGGEVTIFGNHIAHFAFLEIVDFVEDYVDPFFEVAAWFSIPAIEFAVELNH